MKEIKLFWEGLWDITDEHAPISIPESPGILMLIEASYTPNKIGFDTESYRLIELCETMNIYSMVRDLKKIRNWKSKCTHRLLLKVAQTDPGVNRQELLDILNGSEEAYTGYSVSNAGYKLPLRARYTPSLRVAEA